MTTRFSGTCRKYDDTRYFGFITGDDGSDHFVGGVTLRESGVKNLQAGDRVEFEVGMSNSGRPQAVNIVALP